MNEVGPINPSVHEIVQMGVGGFSSLEAVQQGVIYGRVSLLGSVALAYESLSHTSGVFHFKTQHFCTSNSVRSGAYTERLDLL